MLRRWTNVAFWPILLKKSEYPYLADGAGLPNLPETAGALLSLFIAFVAIPRIVFGPVFLVIEGATFFLVRESVARALLAVVMLMDLIPLSMFALHLARASR